MNPRPYYGCDFVCWVLPFVSRFFEESLLVFNDLRRKEYFSVPILVAITVPFAFLSPGPGHLGGRSAGGLSTLPYKSVPCP